MTTTNGRLARWLLALILVALFLGALVSIGVSILPFAPVKAWVDSFSADGTIDLFTRAFFERLAVQFRFFGVGLFLVGAATALLFRTCERFLLSTGRSFRGFFRDVIAGGRSVLREETTVHLGALFALVLIGTAVRLAYISQPMRHDESYTFLQFARWPLLFGLSDYHDANNHPFNTLLIHLSYLVFGNHPWAIRLPALIAGILIIPLSYLVVRSLYDGRAGLLTAGAVASSYGMVFYSTNARGYTVLVLITLAMIWLARYVRFRRNRAAWLLFGALGALGFYTIPQMLFAYGALIVWLFLSIAAKDSAVPRAILFRNLVLSGIVTAVGTVILYSPILAVMGLDRFLHDPHARPMSWSLVFALLPGYGMSVWKHWTLDATLPVVILLAAGVIIGHAAHRRIAKDRVPVFAAALLGLLLVMLALRVVPGDTHHGFFARTALFLLPIFFGVSFAGITYLLKPVVARLGPAKPYFYPALSVIMAMWMGGTLLASRSFAQSDETGSFRDAEAVAKFLKSYLKPGDQIVYGTPGAPLEYYAYRQGISTDYLEFTTYLKKDINQSARLIVVVNEQPRQYEGQPAGTLEALLDQWGVDTRLFAPPKRIKEFKEASVYELVRRDDGTPRPPA